MSTYCPGIDFGVGDRIRVIDIGIGSLDRETTPVGHRIARVHRQIQDRRLQSGWDPPRSSRAPPHAPSPPRSSRPATDSEGLTFPRPANSHRPAWDRAVGRREKASSRCGQRCGLARAIRRLFDRSLDAPASAGTSLRMISRFPTMTCRMLLKSCATPPVSCPTASIFCACRSASSFSCSCWVQLRDLSFEIRVELAQGRPERGSARRSRSARPGSDRHCRSRRPLRLQGPSARVRNVR